MRSCDENQNIESVPTSGRSEGCYRIPVPSRARPSRNMRRGSRRHFIPVMKRGWNAVLRRFPDSPTDSSDISSMSSDPRIRRRAERDSRRPFGNYIPVCGGMAVLGPGRKALLLSVIGLFGLLILLCLTHARMKAHFGYGFPFIGYFLWVLFFYFFLKTATADPGVVPKNVTYSDYLVGSGPKADDVGHMVYFCSACGKDRPPRTYHCTVCNVCIRRLELHVPYMGLCVGERNRAAFFGMNTSVLLFAAFIITTNAILIQENPSVFGILTSGVCVIVGAIMLLLPNCGIFIFVLRFFLVAIDRTFREEVQVMYQGYPTIPPLETSYFDKFITFLHPSPLPRSFIKRPIWIPVGGQQRMIARDWRWFCQNVERNRHIHHHLQLGHENQNLIQPQFIRRPTFGKEFDGTLDNANSAKRKSHYSNPVLSNGALPMLPSTRARVPLHSHPWDEISSNVAEHQRMIVLPRATLDVQLQQRSKLPGTLSFGDMPHMSYGAERELITAARASQWLQLVDFIQCRNRVGLLQFAERVNVGELLGTGRIHPQNLEIATRPNNGPPYLTLSVRHGIFRLDIVQRRLGELTRMIAAGLISRENGLRIQSAIYSPPALLHMVIQHRHVNATQPHPRTVRN